MWTVFHALLSPGVIYNKVVPTRSSTDKHNMWLLWVGTTMYTSPGPTFVIMSATEESIGSVPSFCRWPRWPSTPFSWVASLVASSWTLNRPTRATTLTSICRFSPSYSSSSTWVGSRLVHTLLLSTWIVYKSIQLISGYYVLSETLNTINSNWGYFLSARWGSRLHGYFWKIIELVWMAL